MADRERESYQGADCPHGDLHQVGRSRHRRARRPALRAHRHAGWELCCIDDGEVEWWAGERRYRLPPGSVYWTAPDEWHGAVDDVMRPCRLLWCQIDAARVGRAWDDLPRHWHDREGVAPPIVELLAECRAPDRHSRAAVDALLTRLVIAVQRSAAGATGERELPPSLARLEARLAADPAWWPSIDELTAAAETGRTHLFQLARRHWREAPLAHLNRLRVRIAQERLVRDAVPVTALAHDLGYASSQHFATAFKRVSGLSPSAFRREHMDT